MNSPLQIVILNDYGFNAGGSSNVALQQAEGLSKLGHRVTYLCAMPTRSDLHAQAHVPGAERVLCSRQWDLVNETSKPQAFLRGFSNHSSAGILDRFLREKADKNTVILVNSFSKALSGSFMAVAQAYSVPVVVVAHDYFMWCPNGGWYNYKTRQPCNLRPLTLACLATNCDKRSYAQKLWRSARLVNYRMSGLPEKLAAVIHVSDFSRKVAHEMGEGAARDYVLPLPVRDHGICVEVASNEKFVYLGRMDADKGAIVFANAVKATGLPAIFLGDGEEYESIRKMGLPNVEILGWQPASEVRRQLQHARALVFPTLSRETFGLSVYEAAGMGIPSIVSAGSAPTQFVENDVNGFVFDMGSVTALAQQMLRVATEPGLAKRLGEEALSKFHSVDRSIDGYSRRLAEILNEVIST